MKSWSWKGMLAAAIALLLPGSWRSGSAGISKPTDFAEGVKT